MVFMLNYDDKYQHNDYMKMHFSKIIRIKRSTYTYLKSFRRDPLYSYFSDGRSTNQKFLKEDLILLNKLCNA